MMFKRGYFSLLILLIGILLFSSVVKQDSYGRFFTEIILSAILLNAVYSINKTPLTLLLGILFGSFALVSNWSSLLVEIPQLALISQFFTLMFFVLTIYVISREIFSVEEVKTDTLYGAACVYFLIGFAWSDVYMIIDLLQPDSFTGKDFFDNFHLGFAYFSFVTLTTLGYGDITPITHTARMYTVLEAATGQLYISILVARLVGLYLYKTRK